MRRANSVFSVIYEHIEIPFHFSVSLSLRSPQCNIDIWAEGHTAHSSLPHCAHDPLSAWLVVLTRRQYVCVCVRACLCTRELRPQRIFCVCGSISALARICRYSQCLQIEINLWRTLLIVVFIEMQPRRFVVQI